MPISKTEFARRRNVTKARLSQWIKAGKISGAAIVGTGRNAKIDEALACRQLDETLDIDRRFGSGLKTNLQPTVGDAPIVNTVERRIAEQKLEEILRRNRQAATQESVDLGELCTVEAARQQTVREVAQVVARFEGSLTELASAIAARFKLPQRDVLHLLRGKWRTIRSAAAIEARERAEPMRQTVGYDLDDA